MPAIKGGFTRSNFVDRRTEAEISSEIKRVITIPVLAQQLFPGWKPDTSCLSPFRDEKKPSFSVYADNRKWKDHGTGEGGDVFDFYQKAKGIDKKAAFLELKAILDGATVSAAPIIATSPERPKEEKQQFHPSLSKPTDADLTAIYHLRSIWTPALQFAVDRGLLFTATLKGQRAFIITDRTRKSYNARRIDGKVWDHLPSKPKAWLLYGSNGNWPIGLPEAEPFPSIALCEDGPDFLAAFGHAYASSVQHLAAPVCMSGASSHIPTDALPYFKDQRVRIFVHDDKAGQEAWERWAGQLYETASRVDGFSFGGLTSITDETDETEGSPVTDLNDLLTVSYDCWEKNQELIEGVMNFATEGEQQ
jgi:hypothetical protein